MKPHLGLLQQRLCWVPTWRGWFALLVLISVTTIWAGRHVHDFLAVNEPYPGGALVVEGWAPDYVFKEAMAEFKRYHYDQLLVTGGPIEKGAPLFEYKTVADVGVATLARLGMDTNSIHAVPMPKVPQDRTFNSALFLKQWLLAHGGLPSSINIMTLGAHARRTRLMFEETFGPAVHIGIVAIPNDEYDAAHWWRTSAGVRTVMSELLSYGYARLIFRCPE